MKICKKCIQPDTRPGIFFNDEGVCGACLWIEEQETINWDLRFKELEGIANWAKKKSNSNYDCAIGVSGGKDSTKQALTARDRLNLNCLLVNFGLSTSSNLCSAVFKSCLRSFTCSS